MKTTLESAVRGLWRLTERPGREVFADPERIHRRSLALLRAYYGVLALYLLLEIRKIPRWLEPPREGPLWPLFWTQWLPWRPCVVAIGGLFVVGTFAALLVPRARLARLAAFLGLFLFLGVWYSQSGVKHSSYVLLLFAFFAALLPGESAARESSERLRAHAMTLWGGIVAVLMTYSMAGFMKVVGVAQALVLGDLTVLHPGIVPSVMLNAIYKRHDPPLLADLILDHPFVAFFGFYLAVYVELVSILVAFRPRLMRSWFLTLALFHVMTLLTMNIFFEPAVAVLLVLFVFSPFSPPRGDWREALSELPGLGPLLDRALLRRLRRHTRQPAEALGAE